MIDQYKYTWKMIKPLIPIIFLALWVILFEDKIWPDWENELPVKIFSKGELQWEFDMDSELAKENYRFEFIVLGPVKVKCYEMLRNVTKFYRISVSPVNLRHYLTSCPNRLALGAPEESVKTRWYCERASPIHRAQASDVAESD